MCQIHCLSSIKLTKDKHNVILILVSSSKFNYSRGSSNSRFQLVHLFFFSRSSKLSQLCNHGDLSKIFTRIHLVFSTSFSFRLFILLLPEFLHGGYTWWFIKDLYPLSKSSSRFFSEELKYSLSCILKCNSFNRIIRGGIMSFLIIWVHASWFTYC